MYFVGDGLAHPAMSAKAYPGRDGQDRPLHEVCVNLLTLSAALSYPILQVERFSPAYGGEIKSLRLSESENPGYRFSHKAGPMP